MTGRTNTGGGSAFAVIDISYPEGAACTCSNGVRTMQAKDTSGHWMFQIPRAGEWTVTAENESSSKSETVDVEESRAYSLDFKFELILFNNGSYAPETGGWSCIDGNKLKITANAPQYERVEASGENNSAIDLSSYSTLHVEGISASATSERGNMSVQIISASGGGAVVTTGELRGTSNQTKTLDISNLSGSYFIQLTISVWSDTDGTLEISKVWVD